MSLPTLPVITINSVTIDTQFINEIIQFHITLLLYTYRGNLQGIIPTAKLIPQYSAAGRVGASLRRSDPVLFGLIHHYPLQTSPWEGNRP